MGMIKRKFKFDNSLQLASKECILCVSCRDNADKKQDCQGDCQHTACSACRFVHDSDDCVKCRQDDFNCMKRFAKCMKKKQCTKSIFPCRRKTSVSKHQKQHFIKMLVIGVPRRSELAPVVFAQTLVKC